MRRKRLVRFDEVVFVGNWMEHYNDLGQPVSAMAQRAGCTVEILPAKAGTAPLIVPISQDGFVHFYGSDMIGFEEVSQ